MNYLISHYLFKHLSPVYNRFNSITCFQHSYTECLKKERTILGSWIQKWEWGVGGGGTYFWRQSSLEFCGYHSLSDCTVSLVHFAYVLLLSSHTKRRFSIIRQIDDWWEFALQSSICMLCSNEAFFILAGAGGGGTYVPSLNFKYSCSASLGVGHVPFSIEPIFMSFVANSSSHMSLFQGHVTCRNFALAGPH